jgi:hypothetical protein
VRREERLPAGGDLDEIEVVVAARARRLSRAKRRSGVRSEKPPTPGFSVTSRMLPVATSAT